MQVTPSTGTKKCSRCEETKLLSEFKKSTAQKDGVQPWCQSCQKTYMKAYREANKDRQKSYENARTEDGSNSLNCIKVKAKKKGLPFDLTLEDITSVTHCPVFGWELKRGTMTGKPQHNSPSVDRIVPELGYVKENIQILSNKANSMKSDATPEELIMFAEWIFRTYKNGS